MNIAQKVAHLHIEAGPEKGRDIRVPLDGANIGRSSRNEVVLSDPKLSRVHGRLYFDKDQLLAISDFGSTNETLVNRKPVREQTLYPGDQLEIGDTVLRVLDNTPLSSFATPPHVQKPEPPRRRSWVLPATLLLTGLGVLAAYFWQTRQPKARVQITVTNPLEPLYVSYEHIEASHDQVKRLFVELHEGRARLEIDDTTDGRRITRDKALAPETVRMLIAELPNSGFFKLRPTYHSLPLNEIDRRDLVVTVDVKTHHVSVINRSGPKAFSEAESLLRENLLTELGIGDLDLEPYQLSELARKATERGRAYYRERTEHADGLYRAVAAFEDAIWYGSLLHQPAAGKKDTSALLEECRDELTAAYEDESFKAEQSFLFKEWRTALEHLNRIREMVPDPADGRHLHALARSRVAEEQLSK